MGGRVLGVEGLEEEDEEEGDGDWDLDGAESVAEGVSVAVVGREGVASFGGVLGRGGLEEVDFAGEYKGCLDDSVVGRSNWSVLSFFVARDIVWGAVVGVSSVSIGEVVGADISWLFLVREDEEELEGVEEVEEDDVEDEEGLLGARGELVLEIRCASWAVSCAISGLFVLWDKWERDKGREELGVKEDDDEEEEDEEEEWPILLWRGDEWLLEEGGLLKLELWLNGEVGASRGLSKLWVGCELFASYESCPSSCPPWWWWWTAEEEEEDNGGEEGLPGCFCLGRIRRRALVNQLLIWLRVREVVVASPAFSSSVG